MPTVQILADNVSAVIKGSVDYDTSNQLSEACSYEVQGSEYMSGGFRGRGGPRYGNWDGRKRLYHKGTKRFPTGLLSKVVDILVARGYEVSVNNDYEGVLQSDPVVPNAGWELRGYQQDAVDMCIEAKRCMMKVATGGGKTVMAGHLIGKVGYRSVFLVHTKDLLYQAHDTFVSMYGESFVGIVGDGHRDILKTIVVATIQTVSRALEVEYKNDSFSEDSWVDNTTLDEQETKDLRYLVELDCGLVMMDECHRVAAPTATNVLNAFVMAEYRIGLSASPWRDDGADIALEAVFGNVAVNINASWLIDNGWLVQPIIKIVAVPAKRFAKGTQYATIYSEYIVGNEERNGLVLHEAIKLVKQGRPTMVLVTRINHGSELAERLSGILGFEVPFISGKDDADIRKRVIDAVRRDDLKCFVATTIADEGLDIKPLSGLVLAGGGKSSTRALQRVGRSLRPWKDKKNAVIIDFEDNARYLYDHTQARIRMYESEERFVITG